MTSITYGHYYDGLTTFPSFVRGLIAESGASRVCDVGGGAAALLSPEQVRELSLDYTLLDISAGELAKSPGDYTKIEADATAQDLARRVDARFDFIHSHMLVEHVGKPLDFHRNMFEILVPGGLAVHLMPTLWEPAFVLNRLLPERFTARLLALLQPNRRLHHDQSKFPAYYRWCRGPSRRQLARYTSVGFEVVEVKAYFGTAYALRVPLINKVVEAVIARLIRHPRPALTSYCVVVLRKP